MQDFPANSRKAKTQPEERPRVERVTSAEAVRRKRGLGRQFKDTFIEGSAKSALDYMVSEVVVPAVRDTMFDAIQSGIERLIYGDSRVRRRPSVPPTYSNIGRVNYQGMSTPSNTKPPAPRMLTRQSRTRHDFGEIIIASRIEADEVIERMFDILSRYGSVSVADLYELTGIASAHTDYKWGWTSLPGAKAVRLRDGNFLLDLPEPVMLD